MTTGLNLVIIAKEMDLTQTIGAVKLGRRPVVPPPGESAKQALVLSEELLAEIDYIISNLVSAEAPRSQLLLADECCGSDARLCPHNSCDEQYWVSNEGLSSERQFHNKLYYQVKLLAAAYQQNELISVPDILNRLIWPNEHVTEEPFLSIYATGMVLGMINMAHACVIRSQYEQAYRLAEYAAMILDDKRTRRISWGLAPRPDSECWYRLYELVAELKWKQRDKNIERVFAPADLILEYEIVEQRCMAYMEHHPSPDPSRDARIREALAWVLLQIIKMASVHAKAMADQLIDRFNQLHGKHLYAETGYFQDNIPADSASPWFWDFELFKWCVLGPASEDEACLCHQWRLDSLRRQLPPEANLTEFQLGAERELNYLLHFRKGCKVSHAS